MFGDRCTWRLTKGHPSLLSRFLSFAYPLRKSRLDKGVFQSTQTQEFLNPFQSVAKSAVVRVADDPRQNGSEFLLLLNMQPHSVLPALTTNGSTYTLWISIEQERK